MGGQGRKECGIAGVVTEFRFVESKVRIPTEPTANTLLVDLCSRPGMKVLMNQRLNLHIRNNKYGN